MIDVLDYYNKQNIKFDIVVLLQPTQPLRKSFHIDEAIEKYLEFNEESVVSVSLVNEHPILMREINEFGTLLPLLNETSTIRRQDFTPFYIVNGAVYINKVNELTSNTSLNDNLRPYIMDRRYHVDIDTYNDLKMFELLLDEEGEQ